ncbi:MAG: cation:proton antiporter [Acidobacteria bacterium]|nr:cation:proton antiporter [Acidobacteriota bacterium]
MANLLLELALAIGAAGTLLAVVRLVKGPRAASRAVALDVLTLITMPMMAAYALYAGRAIYLDVALVYGVLSFLGVTALARYADRGV